MKEKIWQAASYLMALGVAALLVNGILYLNYWHPPKYFVENYATEALHAPNHIFLEGREGMTLLHTDSNGYFNPNELDTSKSYVLCLGSSDTQAKSVSFAEQYTQLLEQKLAADGIVTDVYNAGMDGVGLDSITAHFYAAMEKFSGADAIVIEMSWFPGEAELQKAIEKKAAYVPFVYESYVQGLSLTDRIKNTLSGFPLPRVLNNQITRLEMDEKTIPFVSFLYKEHQEEKEAENVKADKSTDRVDSYELVLTDALQKIRREAGEKPVILVFSTELELQKDGTAAITDSPEMIDKLRRSCEAADITFVDMGGWYLEDYEQNHRMARGFFNTSPGEGHMNKTGHQLVADALYEVFREKEFLK